MSGSKFGGPRSLVLVLLLLALALPAAAQRVKEPAHELDYLTFAKDELWVTAQIEDGARVRPEMPRKVAEAFDRLRDSHGKGWRMNFDRVTGRPALLEGEGIPWIPGTANRLTSEDLGLRTAGMAGQDIPLEVVAERARAFLRDNPDLLGVNSDDLALNLVASGPILDYLYWVHFDWTYHGIPVHQAGVVFRLNHGNLIQVGQDYVSDAILSLDPTPALSLETAWQIVRGYTGVGEDVEVAEPGRLLILPVSRPEVLAGERVRPGRGLGYRLAYELSFRLPGVGGTWQGRVDAHTGELLSFLDANLYGHIQGGVHLTDGYPADTSMPFPYANYSGTTLFADVAGNFAGTTGTSTLVGDLVRITDSCGTISQAADGTGLIDFGTSTGTNCTTPGHGGAGNTRAARTQYWHVTAIKIKALSYMPTNNWLGGQLLDRTNLTTATYCPGNAWWDGTALNFCVGDSDYGNTGELPGVSLHEWGHGMDANDGRAPADEGTGETYGDFSGVLQTHQSCVGAGFFGTNCDGYGDACKTCKGIRDVDWAAHADNNPHTPFMLDDTDPNSYTCRWWAWPQTYNGPCRYEGHCESYISSETCWDLAVRDLPAMGIDATTSWQIMDRLWYASRSTAQSAYTCTTDSSGNVLSSNGGNAGSHYNIFRAVDDCDGNLTNGTPHANAIFDALARHNIAVGADGDATNQNQTSCCPTLATPAISVTAASCQNTVSWNDITNAVRYDVYRNETSCTAGFTRIGSVNDPGTSFADTAVAEGTTYYYRVQAVASSDACVSAMSNCVSRVAAACGGICTAPGAPNLTAATPACTGVSLAWTAGTGTTSSYNVYRGTSATCPASSYTQIAGPLTTLTYSDTTAVAGTTYAYVVRGACDVEGLTESVNSNCRTAARLSTPTAPSAPTVTDDCAGLLLSWPAVTGSTSYTVQRGTKSNCSGQAVLGTSATNAYTDATATVGTTYYYTVIATNSCGSSLASPCGSGVHSMSSAPAAPGAPTFANLSCATLTVNWTAVSGATGYDLYRRLGACGAGSVIASNLTGTTYNDSGLTASTQYSYYLVAKNGCGSSAAGTCASVTTASPPSAPTGLSATGSCTAVALSWTASSGATSYNILRTTSTTCSTGLAQIGTSATTSYSDSTAVAGTTYYYVVQAASACGTSANSSCASAARLSTPAAPTGVTAAGTCSGVTVAWTDSAGATSHNVVRGTACGTAVTTFTGVTTPYADTTAAGGTAYQYWVVAVNACGSSVNSACAAATRLATPTAPAAPTYASVACTTLTVNWTAVPGATSYDLYRVAGACGTGAVIAAGLTGTTFDDTGLAASTQYSYYLTAKNTCGSSATGACSSISTTAGPNAPAAPTVTDGCTGLTVSWPVATGAATYTVYRRSGGCGTNSWSSVQSGLVGLSWTDTGAALGSTYGYYIEAVNSCGTATSGNAACTAGTHGLQTPSAPGSISATGTCADVTVSWGTVSGATSYDVLRGSVCGTVLVTFTGVASPYHDTGAAAGTTYQYWVVARNACGTSAPSACAPASRLASPVPTITGAAANVCPVPTVPLATESGMSGYQWYRDGSPIGGATSSTHSAALSGSYTVSYTAANGCAGTSSAHAVTISPCIPHIVYQSHTGPTALNEDGDGVMEAGEKWSVTVTVTNDGQADATAVLGSLAGEGLQLCTAAGSFGDITVGGTGSATFEFVIDPASWYATYACGSSLGFDLAAKSSDAGAYVYTDDTDFASRQVGQAGGSTNESATGPTVNNIKNTTKTSLLAPAFTLATPVDGASVTFTLSGHTDPATCVQVDLVAPGGASTTLKALGVPAASPYDVKAFYDLQGPGAYTLRITEQVDCGGSSVAVDVSGIAMSVSVSSPGECDTWGATCSCTAITGTVAPTTEDLNGPCADEGVLLSWPSDPAEWGDAGIGVRTYDVLRDGAPLSEGLAYGTTNFTDTSGTDGVSYAYAVVYRSGCGNSTTSASAAGSDLFAFPSPTVSGPSANTCPETGALLSTEGGMSAYQWYLDGTAISGANGDSWTAVASGAYSVEYTDASGCTGSSGMHAVTLTPCAKPAEVSPGATTDTALTWSDATTLAWQPDPLATSHTLYRGVLADLQNGDLFDLDEDSCTRPNTGAEATGLTEDPGAEAGRFYWYLVTATNAAGEGTAGFATDGSERLPNALAACP